LTLRFGVLGCGLIAYWTHLRLIPRLRHARLIAAADPDPRARERARQLTGLNILEDPAALLARPDVDAVVISAPSHLHASLAIAAAQAGKHVYLEKPVAIDRPSLHALEAAVRAAGVRFATGFNRRHHPLFVQARHLLHSGAIGSVRSVFSSFCEPASALPAWKQQRSTGGGVLLDLGSHHTDLLRWFLNAEVTHSECRLASLANEHDEAWLQLRFSNGAASASFFSFRAAQTDFFEFLGESGTLRVDRHRATLTPGSFSPSLIAWRTLRRIRSTYDPSYQSALQAFVDDQPGATLEDGARSLEILLSAEASCASS
jgi:predicted dehydrogenase